jgi:hypothetical protein
MRFTKLMTLLFGTLLFLALGASNASAMDKCGAGKCGDAKPSRVMKCGASNSKDMTDKGCQCEDCNNPNCAAKLDPSKPCDCKEQGKMKCGSGKCGK